VGAAFLVLYLLIQLISLNLRQKTILRPSEKIIVWLAKPSQDLVGGCLDWAGGIWENYIALVDTSKLNEELKKERDGLRREITELQEVRIENQRLRQLLDMGAHGSLKLLAAEVIASGASPYERVIRVDRGKDDGVLQGMAVLHARGVVGQILTVLENHSDVLLLTDAASAVDVVVQRSRARGILRGSRPDELHFEYLPKAEDVQAGDEVITSGLDGVYPQGVTIGTVTRVDPAGEGLFLSASVRPYVDFRRVEEVMIVVGGKK